MKYGASTKSGGADLFGFFTTFLPHFYTAYQASLIEKLAVFSVPGSPVPRDLAQTFVSPTLYEWPPETPDGTSTAEISSAPTGEAAAQGRPLDIWEAMRRHPLLALVGPPGIGKSALLKVLAWQCASGNVPRHQIRLLSFERHDKPLENLVPVYVPLDDPSLPDADLLERMLHIFATHGFPKAARFLRGKLERGECLLLFDGLSQIADEHEREWAVAEIVALARQHSRNQILVTAQMPGDLGLVSERRLGTTTTASRLVNRGTGWRVVQKGHPLRPGFGVVQHGGFSREAARQFVKRWFAAQGSHTQEETRDGLLDLLQQSPGLNEIAGCPLCLTAMVSVEGGVPWLQGARLTPIFDMSSKVLLEWPDGDATSQAQHVGNAAQQASAEMDLLEDIATYLHIRKARTLLPEQLSKAVHLASPEAVLSRVARSHLLQQDTDGGYHFAHQPWQAYFAARALSRPHGVPAVNILQYADDVWWHDVIAFVAGHLPDATALIRDLRHISQSQRLRPAATVDALFLAARCVAEAQHTEASLHDEILDDLLAVFQGQEPELWTKAALAVAGVVGKSVPEALLDLLRTGPVERRAAAAVALGRIGGDWAVAPITKALWGQDWPALRQRAAWALGRIGGAGAIQRLVETLSDPHEEVRFSAVEALGALGPTAVPSLISSLGDHRPFVSEAAVDALSRIGVPAVEPLIRALGDPRDVVGSHVVECLSRIARPAVSPLASALEDDNALVRQRAARALGEIGRQECVPTLVRRVDDPEDEVFTEVKRALVRFGQRATQPLIAALDREQPEARQRVIDILEAIGPPAIRELSHALGHENRNIRRRAVEALGVIGGDEAVEALSGALDDERSEVRRRAVEALGQIGGAEARDALIRALADGEPGVRRQVVAALGQLENDDRALIALMDALRDENTDVREMATQVLGRARRHQLVDPFITALRDREVSVRRRAAAALGRERDERAVGPLIEALTDDDFQVRELAAGALRTQGTLAVEPLIRAIYDLPLYDPARQIGVRILGEISIHDREADTWLANLAGIYFEIWTRDHSLDELLQLFTRLQWWPHGFELQQSFITAKALLSYQRVADIAQCVEDLEWMSRVNRWLRPALKDVLTEFSRVGDYLNLYRTAAQQSARHEGLIGAVYRLEGLREVIYDKLDQTEAAVFGRVAEHWRELLTEAQRQVAGGRANLALEIRTSAINLGRPGSPVIISVELINRGDSPARNLRLILRRPLTGGFEIEEGQQTKTLYPLGSSERRTVEFAVVPHGPGEAELTFEARYADNEDPDGFRLLSGRVRFEQRRAEYVPIQLSPYITGLPVKTQEMFFGREDVFEWVRNNLKGKYQDNVLVLWGQRRTGKTSVLYQLQVRPPSMEHVFVLVDLQEMVREIRDHPGLFHGIARRMHEQLETLSLPVERPSRQEYSSYPEERFKDFCREIERHLDSQRVVLMLDEFDILLEKVQAGVIDGEVFGFIRGLMQHSDKLSFMFSGTYELRRKQQERGWILFNTAITRKISFLDPEAALRLIEEPVEGTLAYHRLATDKILSVTSGHPYYIQYICNALVNLARRQKKNNIDLTDVNEALETAVDEVMGNIDEDFQSLSRPEQWTLAALAHISGEGRSLIPRVEIETALKDGGLSMPLPDLMSALQQLVERDFVEEKTEGQRFLYGFRMELARMWLRKSKRYERFREEVR